MVQLGKVYGNRMVDLQPKSRKLLARAVRLVSELGRVSEKKAKATLRAAGGNAKTAILMAREKIGRAQAARLLRDSQGRLYRALQTSD